MKMKLKINGEIYEVEVGELDERPVLVTVNNEVFEIYPEETLSETVQAQPVQKPVSAPVQPVASPPKPQAQAASGRSVVAPIPGTVEAIKVREGEEVKSGQELFILEAMKMKNSIRANRDGKIAKIYVSVGDQVPHNHVLLDFSE